MIENTEIVTRLTRLEEKLDAFLFRTTTIEGRINDHDTRLRSLETSSAKMLGLGAGAAAIVSMIAQYIPLM